jgi:RND superfamily putative drug exporter
VHRVIHTTADFVRRHRWLVLGAWGVLLVAALPLAKGQSDHLSGGGFTVPGSGSLAVDKELRKDFPHFERSPLIAVVAPERGATPREVLAARTRLLHAVRAEPHVRVAGPRSAAAPLSVKRPSLIPLRTARGDDQNIDTARKLRQRLRIADQSGPVRLHLVGYGALWSGLNVTSKKDLASAEKIGFPIVAAILLAVFG